MKCNEIENKRNKLLDSQARSKKKNQNMRKMAFTLIELLVVIGIITVLITISTASYSTAQRKSRDVKRKGDLKSIQNAFEQYYSVNSFQYPLSGSIALSGSLTGNSLTLITYPTDPTGGYYQCSSCSLSSYQICLTLESETPASYCLSNQQ